MIDDISLQILKILQQKARIPNVEVSRQVGLAPSAILERVRKLEKSGIIEGYEVRLNPEQFQCGQIAYVSVFTLESPSQSPSIGDQLSELVEAQEVHYVAGDDSYLVKLRVANTKELDTVLRKKISTIKGVTATKTATVLSTFKETAQIPIS
jgi:Lrp/AsnC family transcriptional regulator, leucine-responsive regulatory protein